MRCTESAGSSTLAARSTRTRTRSWRRSARALDRRRRPLGTDELLVPLFQALVAG
ncbi:hypothetical protein [Nannocystis pusilla]|uniref:hypothetical protein n=1 Tax=Nannocystis pusilla TaxID=889268 RepID=UPI003B765899